MKTQGKLFDEVKDPAMLAFKEDNSTESKRGKENLDGSSVSDAQKN